MQKSGRLHIPALISLQIVSSTFHMPHLPMRKHWDFQQAPTQCLFPFQFLPQINLQVSSPSIFNEHVFHHHLISDCQSRTSCVSLQACSCHSGNQVHYGYHLCLYQNHNSSVYSTFLCTHLPACAYVAVWDSVVDDGYHKTGLFQ